jgi:hypothetical protein
MLFNQFQVEEPIVYSYGVPCPYYPPGYMPPLPLGKDTKELPELPSDEEHMPSEATKIREGFGIKDQPTTSDLYSHLETTASQNPSVYGAPVTYTSQQQPSGKRLFRIIMRYNCLLKPRFFS